MRRDPSNAIALPPNGIAPTCKCCNNKEAMKGGKGAEDEFYITFWDDPICFDCYMLQRDNDPEH